MVCSYYRISPIFYSSGLFLILNCRSPDEARVHNLTNGFQTQEDTSCKLRTANTSGITRDIIKKRLLQYVEQPIRRQQYCRHNAQQTRP